MIEPIEQANLRLIHALGVDGDGRPCVADVACKERARVMRLAGTVNYKTGQHARIVEADFALPAYALAELVGDAARPLPHPPCRAAGRARARRRGSLQADRAARVLPAARRHHRPARRARVLPRPGARRPPPVVQRRRRGLTGLVLPLPADCGARGAIYDLASVLLGGPWGRELRGTAFTRARARVREAFGDVG